MKLQNMPPGPCYVNTAVRRAVITLGALWSGVWVSPGLYSNGSLSVCSKLPRRASQRQTGSVILTLLYFFKEIKMNIILII